MQGAQHAKHDTQQCKLHCTSGQHHLLVLNKAETNTSTHTMPIPRNRTSTPLRLSRPPSTNAIQYFLFCAKFVSQQWTHCVLNSSMFEHTDRLPFGGRLR
eukprot:906810-Amphidinium_carterae.1